MILTENNKLAQNIFEREYYEPFRNGDRVLEIFLLGGCKNNCKYCYLKTYGDELFSPTKYQIIANNFQLIINWYIKNKFKNRIDIFSGEWLTIPILRDQIFDILYNSFKDIDYRYKPYMICFPDNMNFIDSEEHTNKIQEFIDKMQNIGVRISISASIDGMFCEENRTPLTEERYNKIFAFMQRNNYLVHSMISKFGIENQIDNYLWWKYNSPLEIFNNRNTLEVRDNNWDEDSINHYLNYLNFLIEDKFYDLFQGNKIKFLKQILFIEQPFYHDIYCFPIRITNSRLNCTFGCSLVIKANDLSVDLCHRLAYPELTLGEFIVENNEISYFDAKHIELLIMKEHTGVSTLSHCENCQFAFMCSGPCLGAAYEAYKNPLIPPKTVCDLLTAKNTFLIIKYNELGLWDYLDKVMSPESMEYKYLKAVIDNVLEGALQQGIYYPEDKQDA